MGQATRIGLLASVLLLACNHERVDLGGTGAGGSTVLPPAGRRPPSSSVPQLPSSAFLQAPTQPPLIATETSRASPPFVSLMTQPQLVPPISGGTLAVAADGSVAVAADADRDLLYLVDLTSDAVQTLMLPAQSEPGRVVLDDQGHAHVVLRSSGQLARVELAAGHVALSEPLCLYPRGLAYSAQTRSVHVACADGPLVELDAESYDVLASERQGVDLRDVVLGPDGTRIIARFRSANLLSLSPNGATERVLPDLPWPASLGTQTNAASPSTVSTRATFAFRTVSAPDGTLWMLHERAQNDLVADDDYRGTGCGSAVQPALTQLDARATTILSSLQLQGTVAPAVDLAISANGTWIALATPSSFAQSRASARLYRRDALIREASIELRSNPEFPNSPSVVCTPVSFVALTVETQSVAVAFDGHDNIYVQSRFPARLDIIAANAVDPASTGRNIPLNEPPARDLGHEWFHAELDDSRLSCAACHAEGMDDAHVWQSSRGPRRTPSLRGGLSRTAPFAWGGEHASLDSVIKRFSVRAQVPDDAISGIGSWLDKLPALPVRSLTTQDETAAASGKAIFESAQLACAQCHSGPQLTNNQTLDVGTGGAFQVPSLSGLALRAPYMHDGCAEDLSALFAKADCARQGHAQLAALSDDDAASLLSYLQTL